MICIGAGVSGVVAGIGSGVGIFDVSVVICIGAGVSGVVVGIGSGVGIFGVFFVGIGIGVFGDGVRVFIFRNARNFFLFGFRFSLFGFWLG